MQDSSASSHSSSSTGPTSLSQRFLPYFTKLFIVRFPIFLVYLYLFIRILKENMNMRFFCTIYFCNKDSYYQLPSPLNINYIMTEVGRQVTRRFWQLDKPLFCLQFPVKQLHVGKAEPGVLDSLQAPSSASLQMSS